MAAERKRLTPMEQARLLEDFYENLGNEEEPDASEAVGALTDTGGEYAVAEGHFENIVFVLDNVDFFKVFFLF